jgi:hypothetical protein
MLTCDLLLKKKKRSLVRERSQQRNDHRAINSGENLNVQVPAFCKYSSLYDFADNSVGNVFVVYGCYKMHAAA